MKKTTILTFASVLITINYVYGQIFEGIIIYEDHYFSNFPEKPNRIDTTILYIKDGMYRKPFVGNRPGYHLLKNDSSYFISFSSETISKDMSYSADLYHMRNKFQSVRQPREREKIAGYSCSKYKRIRQQPGFEEISILSIADSLKTNLNYGLWLFKDYGIALKIVLKFDSGTHIINAISIKPTPLNDNLFKLPDYPIEEVFMERIANKSAQEKNNGN